MLVLDAAEGVTEQDAHVAGYILERGRAVVLAVNKWDAADKEAREQMKSEVAWKLGFLNFAEVHTISAKEGKGLARPDALGRRRLRRGDGEAADAQADPRAGRGGRAAGAAEVGPVRPKLRYAHQGGMNPPRVIIHGNALERVPDSYKRYLEGFFRDKFELVGTPMRIEFRTGRNPYAPRKDRSKPRR